MTRVVCISDTHLQHKFSVPDGDLLVHAGDMTGRGELPEIVAAADWLASLPHKHKAVIAGNHDWGFQRQPLIAPNILRERGITYLQDTSALLDGLKVYGAPWQPVFFDWAFNVPRGKKLADKWRLIPQGVDILITHGPPYGHGDGAPPFGARRHQSQVGCIELLLRVRETLPRLHVFGHIHRGYGVTVSDAVRGTVFANASICNENYDPVHQPLVFDVDESSVVQAFDV